MVACCTLRAVAVLMAMLVLVMVVVVVLLLHLRATDVRHASGAVW